MIAQTFVPTVELVIPTGTQTNEANAKIETEPVTVETKISQCSVQFKSNLRVHFRVSFEVGGG